MILHKEPDLILGRTIWFRAVEVSEPGDVALVHRWMQRPHVVEYWEMDWPLERIRSYLESQDADPHRSAYFAFVDDDPVGYLEVYDPAHDILGQHYAVRPGDVGAHVLIGDEDYLGRYSVTLGFATNRFLFADDAVTRIVGEPDVRNHKVLTLLAFLGFQRSGDLSLPDKRAALMICDRPTFARLSTRRRPRK